MDKNKKKVLYTANVPTHILAFHVPYLRWFKEEGFEVHVAVNGWQEIPFADEVFDVPFGRKVSSMGNVKAYRQLKDLCEQHQYDIVHCHTPIAAAITRLASNKSRKKGTRVLYTSHGFNFFKDASLKRWFTFLPAEWLLSFMTDGIITINREDYQYLQKFNFQSNGKYKIDGIGLDPERLKVKSKQSKKDLRDEFAFTDDQILVLYIAEFIERKNHRFIIKNILDLVSENPDLRFMFAGRGQLMEEMKDFADSQGVQDYVNFLGFRKDIGKFIEMSDIGISSSRYEGLGLGVAEMMYNGLPVVISNDRGHRELVKHGDNGFIFEQGDSEQFKRYLLDLSFGKKLRDEVGKKGELRMQDFIIDKSLAKMETIYREYIG